ncbi:MULTISPECIES: hypothetical protein [unclassified Mesorhizobium]|uniref:hypothetical protein n=1 Tax=unclassified Mesorhizobium TaxID=325217 RepID=UPI002417CEA2|nr:MULTISPECIES: hypothetical protein [unclassified Mesorhizobium]MDG4903495.1 hypothetical protein [Mesorhizobium sp. WSM4962]MDG4921455.1 hypothetical protein [Mesorhizobium sp. WSM4989]
MSTGKKDETPEALFERVSLRLRTVGLESAVEALIAVCTDKGSPMPARATAGVALLRANGMLVDKADGGKKAKAPHEMTGDELQAEIDRLKRSARQVQAGTAEVGDNGAEGAFE